MANDIVQTIAEARVDARSLSEFVFKPAGFKVARRLAPTVDTLQFYIDRFDSINSTYTKSVNTVNNAVSQAQQSVIAADALIATNANTASQAVAAAIEGVAIDANLVTDALTVTVPPVGSSGAPRNQAAKNAENISIMDFFTRAELVEYRSSPTTFDASRPIQAFFDYIAVNDVGTASCDGNFYISTGLYYGSEVKTKSLIGKLSLTALNAIDIMLEIQSGSRVTWLGSINVTGVGGVSYASRKCKIGVKIGGSKRSERQVFSSINALQFSYIGVYIDDLTTQSNFGDITAWDCGSGLTTTNSGDVFSLTSEFTDASRTGNASSHIQYTEIYVNELPPSDVPTDIYVRIDGECYFVYEIDRNAKKLTLLMWLPENVTSGNLVYMFGGGVYNFGSDASVNKFQKIDAIRCGIGFLESALYGAIASNLVTQFCGAGIALGSHFDGGLVGGQITGLYCEGNNFDILRVTRANMNYTISTSYALNMDKFASLSAPRGANDVRSYSGIMKGIAIQYRGSYLENEARGADINITDPNRSTFFYRVNNLNLLLQKPDEPLHRIYDYTSKIIMVYGEGTRYTPNHVSFLPPVGWTVNGSSERLTITKSSLDGPLVAAISFSMVDKNFEVSFISGYVNKATFNIDLDRTILANSFEEEIIDMPSVRGNSEIISWNYTGKLNGAVVTVNATTAGKIGLRLQNFTDTDITISSGVFHFKET